MKRQTLFLLLSPFFLFASNVPINARIQVSCTPQTHEELGIVEEDNGVVTRHYVLYNDGEESWQVLRGYTSCGCTTVIVEQQRVVRSGDSTRVEVRFNPTGKGGPFEEKVTIQLSDGEEMHNETLELTGEVRRSATSLQRQFPVTLGDVRLSTNSIDFGEVSREKSVVRHLALYNNSDQLRTIHLSQDSQSALSLSAGTLVLLPYETQDLSLRWDGTQESRWGHTQQTLTIRLEDGKEQTSLALTAILLPTVRKLTEGESALAPRLTTERRITLGAAARGGKVVKTLTLQNTGGSTLHILRAYSERPEIKVSAAFPIAIEPGKTHLLQVEILPSDTHDFPITIISDDARKPRMTVRIQ